MAVGQAQLMVEPALIIQASRDRRKSVDSLLPSPNSLKDLKTGEKGQLDPVETPLHTARAVKEDGTHEQIPTSRGRAQSSALGEVEVGMIRAVMMSLETLSVFLITVVSTGSPSRMWDDLNLELVGLESLLRPQLRVV